MSARVEVAAAVIERPDGAFLMASRPQGKVYAGWWEFPGGKVEPGETARHALERELGEELGISLETAWPWLNRAYDYEHARVMLRFFRVTAWHGEPHPHEGQGALAWVHAARPEVAPILPANDPILRGLTLPLSCAISAATELGREAFMHRLDAALENGLRLIQFREKNLAATERRALARAVAERCAAFGARLMINGEPDLAHDLAECCDVGLHLPSARLMAATQRPEAAWVSASCHDAAELAQAAALGLDFVLLGPVRPTASHPGASHLGWPAFASLIRDYPLPVYALGGLTGADLATARTHGAHGIALKGAAW